MLSEKERDEIYAEEKILFGELIQWKGINGSFRLKVPVYRQNGEELTLYANYGKRRYSFALHHRKTLLIRRWDYCKHKNPDGTILKGPHKHKWTDDHADNFAYEVNDIPVDNLNEALEAFLKECNITVEGQYQTVIL